MPSNPLILMDDDEALRLPDGTAVRWVNAVTLHRQDGDTLDVLVSERGDVVLNRIERNGTHHPVVLEPDTADEVARLLTEAATQARGANTDA